MAMVANPTILPSPLSGLAQSMQGMLPLLLQRQQQKKMMEDITLLGQILNQRQQTQKQTQEIGGLPVGYEGAGMPGGIGGQTPNVPVSAPDFMSILGQMKSPGMQETILNMAMRQAVPEMFEKEHVLGEGQVVTRGGKVIAEGPKKKDKLIPLDGGLWNPNKGDWDIKPPKKRIKTSPGDMIFEEGSDKPIFVNKSADKDKIFAIDRTNPHTIYNATKGTSIDLPAISGPGVGKEPKSVYGQIQATVAELEKDPKKKALWIEASKILKGKEGVDQTEGMLAMKDALDLLKENANFKELETVEEQGKAIKELTDNLLIQRKVRSGTITAKDLWEGPATYENPNTGEKKRINTLEEFEKWLTQ